MTTINTIKNQRTSRKGRLTLLKKQLDTAALIDIRNLELSQVLGLRDKLEKEVALYSELQSKYEELLSKQEEGNEDQTVFEAEIAEGAELQELYDNFLKEAQDMLMDVKFFREAERLQASHSEWSAAANPSARTFITDANNFIKEIKDYLERSELRSTTAVIAQGRVHLRALLGQIHRQINEVSDPPSTTEASTPVTSSINQHKRFDIDLPSFHGNPREWKQFHTLFTTTMERRGKDLSSEERCCLLLKSLKDPQARELAQLNTTGDSGYTRAMDALLNRYGQSRVVLPHYIATIRAPRTYTFSRESLLQFAKEHLTTYQALQAMEVDLSSFLAAHSMTLFDSKLAEEWGKHTMSLSSLPTMEDLNAYVQSLICNLPSSGSPSAASASTPLHKQQDKSKPTAVKVEPKSKIPTCIICNDGVHSLARCPTFRDYNPDRRGKVVREKKWCSNCLHPSHTVQNCSSAFTCRTCGGKHHTLLHRGDSNNSSTPSSTTTTTATLISAGKKSASYAATEEQPPTHAFLNTAMVKASSAGRSQTARLVLDAGSSSSLITEALASRLKLKRYPHRLSLVGAYSEGVSKHFVKATLTSLHDENDSLTLKLSVVSKLPSLTPPTRAVEIARDIHVKDLELADAKFGGSLDIILGCLDVCKCWKGQPEYFPQPAISISPTVFGWTVAGPMDKGQTSQLLNIQTVEDDLHSSLERLWKLEQVPEVHTSTPADQSALQQFDQQYSIEQDGRYCVKLPRVDNPQPLGSSKKAALSRFHQNEKSLSRRHKLEEFNTSLQEYQTLDHAEVVPFNQLNCESYYLPVHGVFKETSTTTKVRPVFDASAKTSTGVSLNDNLLAGPNQYPLLTDILLMFRTHIIGFSADISKMFREIMLNINDRDLHRFLMRDISGVVRDFRMKRLTFGVKSSPFLATKVLHHLAEKHASDLPTASKAILRNFYVDDFLSGANSLEEAVHVREELCHLLSLAGMTLRKWRTSCPEFAETIPQHLRESDNLTLTEAPKALGLHWDIGRDAFSVATPDLSSSSRVTKRLIASVSARVFDILGFFAPFCIRSKLLLQQLWKLGCGWDEEVPALVLQSWTTWTEELPEIHKHLIPRRYHLGSSSIVATQLHGFSDASTLAYGAVVYLRLELSDGSTTTSLVISKARVAPLKQLTIPRSELVAAHLLAKLLVYTANVLSIAFSCIYAWTDSSIVLHWLRKMPSSLLTFAANRVSFIQTALPDVTWRHTPTHQNPADLLSRGVTSSKLKDDTLWWRGPSWLSRPPDDWPQQHHLFNNQPKPLPEQRAVTLTLAKSHEPPEFDLWKKYSCFFTLTRVVAWIRRFTNNCRQKIKDKRTYNPLLTSSEIKAAKHALLQAAQRDSFPELLTSKNNNTLRLPRNHPLSRMNVFKDSNLIMVSGRVRPETGRGLKAVTALSLKSSLTKLLVSSAHRKYLHPGVSTLLAVLSENYFITGLKTHLKKVGRSCAVCQKAYCRPLQPPMGLLPLERTQPSPPFNNTGLDFAGPFMLKKGHTRKPVKIKTYVCIFICFSTKATHIELCSDLTTDAFLAALRRFCARRGAPQHIYSDNGTNFVGAAAEMRQCKHLVSSSKEQISTLATTAEFTWHFNPPRAPNFGGLWEAGVKQMKLLMRKQLQPHPYTFEELVTVLAEVEAILNSRPIVPLDSTEISQDLVITPGHFLIGRPLKSPPHPSRSTANISSLRRWNLVQRLQQDLWLAWQGWYLETLKQRKKWNRNSPTINVGDIVLIKDEALSRNTNTWPLARISEIFPGEDGVTRVADLYCNGRTYRRALSRLVPLFPESNTQSAK